MCDSCEEIKKLLTKNEKIIAIGYYDTALRNPQDNFSTLPFEVTLNPKGYNVRTAQYYYLNEKINPNIKLIYETYVFSSFKISKNNEKIQIGEITFNGFYPDQGVNGITSSNRTLRFTILGTSGIYNKVTSAIINFNNTKVRKVYFISDN
jgi:hypothetical protein